MEFMLAGANAVSVGTSVFNDPSAPARIHRELAGLVADRNFSRLSDIVGYAHREADQPVLQEATSLDDWDFITEERR